MRGIGRKGKRKGRRKRERKKRECSDEYDFDNDTL
jgi:hypothetical protein